MGRRARVTVTEANCVAATSDTSAMRLDQQGAEMPPAALVTFAEELGRLLARRLLADPKTRRGYSLPELFLGAAIMALVCILVMRGLCPLAR